MKKFRFNTGLVFASWALLLMFGCHKKKPNVPPEGTPPTILSEIKIEPTEPAPEQQAPPPTQPQVVEKQPEKPPKQPSHHPKAHGAAPKKPASESEKPAPTEEAKNLPPRVVIQEGGANSGTGLVTSNSPRDNSSSTQQLLESAEKNVHNIKRALTDDEKSMLAQINDYIQQSRDATREGDTVRAHTLALKAQLLSDELVKKQ